MGEEISTFLFWDGALAGVLVVASGEGRGCPADRNVASSDVPVAPAGLGMAGICVVGALLAFLGGMGESLVSLVSWVGRTLVVPGAVCTVVFFCSGVCSARYRSGSWNREVMGNGGNGGWV